MNNTRKEFITATNEIRDILDRLPIVAFDRRIEKLCTAGAATRMAQALDNLRAAQDALETVAKETT